MFSLVICWKTNPSTPLLHDIFDGFCSRHNSDFTKRCLARRHQHISQLQTLVSEIGILVTFFFNLRNMIVPNNSDIWKFWRWVVLHFRSTKTLHTHWIVECRMIWTKQGICVNTGNQTPGQNIRQKTPHQSRHQFSNGNCPIHVGIPAVFIYVLLGVFHELGGSWNHGYPFPTGFPIENNTFLDDFEDSKWTFPIDFWMLLDHFWMFSHWFWDASISRNLQMNHPGIGAAAISSTGQVASSFREVIMFWMRSFTWGHWVGVNGMLMATILGKIDASCW